MKLIITTTVAALALFAISVAPVEAAKSEAREPVALGLDAGTTAASAIFGAAAAGLLLDVPLAHPLSLTFQPSAYWSSGTDVSIIQLTMAVMMRFYLISLFVPEERQAHWGPFMAAGVGVAWAREHSGALLDVIAFGPDVQAGYRLVFGDRGFFLEPTVAWMSLYGARLDASGATATTNSGISLGFTLGWRF
jgi:hypothetical protein